MDGSKLLMLGGVAIGGYFLYENFFASSLPSDAVFVSQIPIGTAVAVPASFAGASSAPTGAATTQVAYLYSSPSTGLLYTSFTAPTASQVASTASAVSATGSTVATSPAAPVTTSAPATPAVPSGPSLATIWANVQAAASQDANYKTQGNALTPYQWNFYVSYVQSSAPGSYTGTWPPDPAVVFPGVNLSTPMSAGTYWAGMQPYLATAGLSGYLAGLGCFACGMGQADSTSDTAGDLAAFVASGAVSQLDPNAGPNYTGGVAIPGQANLTTLQVATASPQLASSWFSQNSGLLIAGGLAVGALFLIPNINSRRGR